MDKDFNKLKNSNDTFESSFYDAIAKVVGPRNMFVKDYLTWSVNHPFEDPATVQMFPFRGDWSVPPLKICFLSVDQSNDYYLQVRKNSTSSSKILQNPELVRVAYRYMRIFPDTTIHWGGFKNLRFIGNYRIKLHIYDECPYNSMTKNVYFEHYMFSNVTDKQLDLYRFEDVQTNSSSPKVRINNRKSESSSNNNSSYMKARIKNPDSESSSSTKFTTHVNNNLNAQFKVTKGNIKFGKSPKLVLCYNQITQVPSTEPSSLWLSPNKEIKTSSNSDWGTMLKTHNTNSMKSSEPHPCGSTSNAKIPHEVNSLKSSAHLPWGSVSNVTTLIFPTAVTIGKRKKTSVTKTITPCQKDIKLSPKILRRL